MILFVILGLCALVLSVALIVAAARWALRQVGDCDCPVDPEDCL